MRRQEYKCEHQEVVDHLLSEVKIGHVAFQRAGQPEVLPYNFCYLQDHLYLHGSPKTGLAGAAGEKIKFLAYHEVAWIPSTWRHAHLACPATTYFTSLSVSGRLSSVECWQEKALVLEAFMQKYQPENPCTPLSNDLYKGPLRALAVLKLKVENPVVKRKMGQHLTPKQRLRVQDGLRQRVLPGDRDVAQAMAEANGEEDSEGWVESLSLPRLANLVELLTRSYWAQGRTVAQQARWNAQSEVLIARCSGEEVLAFARVSWSSPGTAFLADLIVAPEFRGKGLGKELMRRILSHSRVERTARVLLYTRDAQGFYEQFGFRERSRDSDSLMSRSLPSDSVPSR